MTLKECDMVLETTLNISKYYFEAFKEETEQGNLDWALYNKSKYWLDENLKYLKVKNKLSLQKIRKDAFNMIRFIIMYARYHKSES